jgi:16S rRNA (guanine527-N7)-methyltransferase
MELTTSLLPEMSDIWQQTTNWQPTVQQQKQFQQLYESIIEGNRQLNLTRITEPEEFWEKHLWDSLRGIAPFLQENLGDNEDKKEETSNLIFPQFPNSPTFIDIGTGAGFPGIPTAIVVPNCTVTFLDATRKKITFIEKILSELGITNGNPIIGRAEEIGQQPQHRENYDVGLVRAVGSASACAEYSLPLLKQGGLAVIYRGTWTEDETAILENAVKQLGGAIESIKQFTTPLSNSIRHCLYLRKVANTPAKFPRTAGVPAQKPL